MRLSHQFNNHKFLNVKLSVHNEREWNALVYSYISKNERLFVVSQNLHSLYLQFKHKDLNEIQQNHLVRIDGMAIVLLARLFGNKNIRREHRLTWMDWKDSFFSFCEENNFRIAYVGSKPEFQSKIKAFFEKHHPKLQIENHHGYFQFDSDEERALIDKINSFKPHILLVGMGMPRQERWIDTNQCNIHSNVFLSCGAAMEYITGYAKVPPRWIGQIGFEWLYRLIEKPGRFFHRYLIEPWHLIFYICKYFWTK